MVAAMGQKCQADRVGEARGQIDRAARLVEAPFDLEERRYRERERPAECQLSEHHQEADPESGHAAILPANPARIVRLSGRVRYNPARNEFRFVRLVMRSSQLSKQLSKLVALFLSVSLSA